jgi:hypothetical protein
MEFLLQPVGDGALPERPAAGADARLFQRLALKVQRAVETTVRALVPAVMAEAPRQRVATRRPHSTLRQFRLLYRCPCARQQQARARLQLLPPLALSLLCR